MQLFENDNSMLTKFETIEILNYPVGTFHIFTRYIIIQIFKNSYLNISIFNIHFLVFSNLCSYSLPIGIFVVYTKNNLTKSSLIDNLQNFISVPKLLSNLGFVVAFLVSNRKLILPPNSPNKIHSFINP